MPVTQDLSTPFRAHRLHGASRNQVLARDLAGDAPTLDEGWTGGAAFELCTNHPKVPSFAVLDDTARVIGMIERERLLYQFSQPLWADVYRRRPIGPLVSRGAMIVDAATPIEGVKELIAYRYPQAISSGFAIVEEERYLGIGTMMALLEKTVDLAHLRSVELEEAQRKAEDASAAKSRFLATMSHELRTPLNAIIGFSDLIQRELCGPIGHPSYAGYIKDIHVSGQHLLSIINDILDLSKIEAGKLQLSESVVPIERPVADCCRIVGARAEEAGVALHVAPIEHAEVKVDVVKFKQVLLNILSNAIKFTPPGGQVRVSARIDAAGAALEIADTGIGMHPGDIAVALAPFGQVQSSMERRYEGTGLGLPLARGLMELHNGTLEISSRPGEGTTVRLCLPRERIVPIEVATVPQPERQLSQSSLPAATA